MKQVSEGIGGLSEQPLYAYGASRHGSPLYLWSHAFVYRLIIFLLTSIMIGLTAYKAYHQSRAVAYALALALTIYALLFIIRTGLTGERERQFYDSRIQFSRALASTFGVTVLILLLAVGGIFDHTLWLLYVLGAILVSKHNGTRLLILILVWVTFWYPIVSYIGSAVFSRQWQSLDEFASGKVHLTVSLVGIWLVSFLFHYLMHNILARDAAHESYRRWVDMVSDQWVRTLDPSQVDADLARQLQEWVGYAEQLTGAHARLWLPRLNDGALQDWNGDVADHMVQAAVAQGESLLARRDIKPSLSRRAKTRLTAFLLQRVWVRRDWPGEARVRLFLQPPQTEGVQARLVMPLYRTKTPDSLVGVLDLSYYGDEPDVPAINRHLDQVFDFGDRARLILAALLQRKYLQQEHKLIERLSSLADPRDVARQIVADMVEAYGFDFATVSLVDFNQQVIRPMEGRNAPWITHAPHPLGGNDVQSRVVREGKVYVNHGQLEPWLDKQIFQAFDHRATSRVWVPVPFVTLESDAIVKALATIEAGFHHTHQLEVPAELIHWIGNYARQAAIPLANAVARSRERELLARLERLSDFSQLMQQTTTMLETDQVIRQILAWGQTLLAASSVLLLIPDDTGNRFQVACHPAEAFNARKRVRLAADLPLFELMRRSVVSYTSADARRDPNLEMFVARGRKDFHHNTLRSRRNFKSFVGIRLVNKKQQILGFLCMFYQSRQAFHDDDSHIIGLFARHAAVALEETRANRLMRDIAVMQERNYLEAELHHWLSQQLCAIRLSADTVAAQIDRGDMAEVKTAIANLMEDTQDGSQALEAMLNQLHETPPLAETDFIAEFTDYTNRLQERLQATTLEFVPSGDPHAAPRQVQFYLLRIAKEALNNALKHAQPQCVCVAYDVGVDSVRLLIEDDGIGFDLDRAQASHRYGIRTMEYYADRLNATLDVDSAQGRGTRIEVFVKIHRSILGGPHAEGRS